MPVNIAQLTDRAVVLAAIAEYDDLGQDEFLARHGYGPARTYFLQYDGRTYDSKAVAGVAYERQHPGSHVTAADFSGGELTVARALRALGFPVTSDAPTSTPDDERDRRQHLWEAVLAEPEPGSIPKARLRELGIYGGAQGIWVDVTRTRSVIGAEHGATISVLHTGRSYADDLSPDGVIYHYPTTHRSAGRDASEVEATKTAAALALPVFVISPGEKAETRTVFRGWIEDWDDEARLFLIAFRDTPPAPVEANPPQGAEDDDHFTLRDDRPRKRAERSVRENQAHFKFAVIKRYGAGCAVCRIDRQELIDAAHLCSKRERGSDDPRNGLPLCANHHRALDSHLYGIDPESLHLVARDAGPTLDELGITAADLSHLRRRPHSEALEHLWRSFRPI